MVTHADAQLSPAEPLSDEELLAGGLAPQKVWVRSPAGNQKRKQRNERFRENQAANGFKQISITVPVSLMGRFKAMAKCACETGSLPAPPEMTDGLAPQAAVHHPTGTEQPLAKIQLEHTAPMERVAKLEAELNQEEGIKLGLQQAHSLEMARFQKWHDCTQQYIHSLKAQLRLATENAAPAAADHLPWTKFRWFGSGLATGLILASGSSLVYWCLMNAS